MRGPRVWRWAALAVGLLILVFGVIPVQATVHALSHGHDDLLSSAGHFFENVVFALVLAVAWDGLRASRRALLGALFVAAGLGVAIELVQAFLPYRDAQLSDALLDIAGAALGVGVFTAVVWARVRRPRWRRG